MNANQLSQIRALLKQRRLSPDEGNVQAFAKLFDKLSEGSSRPMAEAPLPVILNNRFPGEMKPEAVLPGGEGAVPTVLRLLNALADDRDAKKADSR